MSENAVEFIMGVLVGSVGVGFFVVEQRLVQIRDLLTKIDNRMAEQEHKELRQKLSQASNPNQQNP